MVFDGNAVLSLFLLYNHQLSGSCLGVWMLVANSNQQIHTLTPTREKERERKKVTDKIKVEEFMKNKRTSTSGMT
jgi:predicted transcriptional regulator of viral defense system